MKNKGAVKKYAINAVIVVVFAALSFYYLTKTDIINEESLKSVNAARFFAVFLYAVLAFLLAAGVDAVVYRTCFKGFGYGKCVINQFIGNLGSNVTPLKSGHFPLMAYYQHRAGVKIGDTVTALVKCQVIYSVSSMFTYSVMTIILAVTGYAVNFYGTTVPLWVATTVGLVFHAVTFGALALLSFFKNVQDKYVNAYAHVYCKFKKKADKNEIIKAKTDKLAVYRSEITAVFTDFTKTLPAFLLYAVFMPIAGTCQYAAYLAVTGGAFGAEEFFTFYALSLAAGYMTNVIPVPGGVGTAEVLFVAIFGNAIASDVIGSVLLLWRLASFYALVPAELLLFALATLICGGKRREVNSEGFCSDANDITEQGDASHGVASPENKFTEK